MTGGHVIWNMTNVCLKEDERMCRRRKETNGKGGEIVDVTC